MSFVVVRGLNKTYQTGNARLHVLRDVDLDVERGEMVALVGASGVGKSTLLHLLGGLDRADSGSIQIGDTDLRSMSDAELVAFRNRNVGFVETFMKLHENEYYTRDQYVEDPVVKVRFPKFAAGATLDHGGQTYFFVDERTKAEFARQKGIATA